MPPFSCMDLTLRQQRIIFSRCISQLVVWAYDALGYELIYEEVKRTDAQAQANAASGAGIANSLHKLGLAADLSLYINGVYQDSSEAHRPIAEKWKSLHLLNRWGGDFRDKFGKPKPDGNHYSSERGGIK